MNPTTSEESPSRPRLATIADIFVRYANFTFGGGSATVAVLTASFWKSVT
jgi:chromate transport protein ChrA